MIDARSQCDALKLKWIQAIKTQYNSISQDFWFSWLQSNMPKVDIIFFLKCNIKPEDMAKVCKLVKGSFWYEILQLWSVWNYNAYPVLKKDILSQPIWFNSLLKINNKILYNKVWYNNNIRYISDLILNNKWCTKQELDQKFNVNINFLELRSLISCMPRYWKYIMFDDSSIDFEGYKIDNKDFTCKYIYKKLLINIVNSQNNMCLFGKKP